MPQDSSTPRSTSARFATAAAAARMAVSNWRPLCPDSLDFRSLPAAPLSLLQPCLSLLSRRGLRRRPVLHPGGLPARYAERNVGVLP